MKNNVKNKGFWKYLLNKNVLSFALNAATFSTSILSYNSGTVFHNCGGERHPLYISLDFEAGCIIANGVMIVEPLMEDTP